MFNFIKKWTTSGIYLPLAYDGETNKPSVTLLFAYGSFVLAVGSVIYLLRSDATEGTAAAITMAVIYNILYRLRKLDKVKLSRDSIEIDSEDEQEKKDE